MSNFQPRYDEQSGTYRDCKWCGGKGCLACPAERDKEYDRQFPNGPAPIATFTTAELERADTLDAAGFESINSAHGDLGTLVLEVFRQVRENPVSGIRNPKC